MARVTTGRRQKGTVLGCERVYGMQSIIRLVLEVLNDIACMHF